MFYRPSGLIGNEEFFKVGLLARKGTFYEKRAFFKWK